MTELYTDVWVGHDHLLNECIKSSNRVNVIVDNLKYNVIRSLRV